MDGSKNWDKTQAFAQAAWLAVSKCAGFCLSRNMQMNTSKKSRVGRWLSAVAVATIMGAFSSVAVATVVNVQFDQPHHNVSQIYKGVAAAPDAGTFWNQINVSTTAAGGTVSGSNLIASDGKTATTIGFTLTGSDLYGAKPPFNFNNDGTGNKLLENFLVGGPHPTGDKTAEKLVISGLTPGAKYDIYFYGSKNPGADSTLTFGSKTVGTDGRLIKGPSRWQVSKTGAFVPTHHKRTADTNVFDLANKGHTWNVIKGLIANGNGKLIGKIGTGSDAAYAAINGFQVATSAHK